MTNITQSPFDSFNARPLSPQAVARHFIPSHHFDTLSRKTHTIIVGPRGSGKTSLLKMLQTEAIESWDHERSQDYRSKIDFTGVFIPTDVNWNEQLKNIGVEYLTEKLRHLVTNTTFITHVHHALVKAMINRCQKYYLKSKGSEPHRRVNISDKYESEIVKALSRIWNISPKIPSFLALKHELKLRIQTIGEFVSEEEFRDPKDREQRFLDKSIFCFNLVTSVSSAIEVFDDKISDPHGSWALLFDELELAPIQIIELIMKSLRSSDNKILFKLSLSPFAKHIPALESPTSPSAKNDFETVRLWYTHKRSSYSFCSELLKSIVKDKFGTGAKLEKIFGQSVFEGNDESEDAIPPYAPGSSQHTLLLKMANNDSSFKNYLDKNHINLSNLKDLSETNRASLIRKILPTLIVRDAFRTSDILRNKSGLKTRSRKRPNIYHGIPALYAITEGNPRWLIGFVNSLLDIYKTPEKIPSRVQEEELCRAAQQFISMLRTIPVSDSTSKNSSSLTDVLDKIGKSIYQSVVLDNFSSEPYGEFVINKDCSEPLVKALGIALNTGAIVYIPNASESDIAYDIKGKTFRLSYLLSPYYRIPIRKGSKISINSIIDNKRISVSNKKTDFVQDILKL